MAYVRSLVRASLAPQRDNRVFMGNGRSYAKPGSSFSEQVPLACSHVEIEELVASITIGGRSSFQRWGASPSIVQIALSGWIYVVTTPYRPPRSTTSVVETRPRRRPHRAADVVNDPLKRDVRHRSRSRRHVPGVP